MAIDGSWNLTLETPFGTQTPTLRIAQGASALIAEGVEIPLQNLTVTGDKAEFVAAVPTPMGTFPISFVANAAGDNLTGTFTSPLGTVEFNGARA